MREQHEHARAAREERIECRQRGANARVVGDRAVVIHRHVEVDPHQDALAAHLFIGEVVDRALGHQRGACADRRYATKDHTTATMPTAMTTQPAMTTLLYEIARSEEHTSELQSHVNLVCRLLLE